MAGNDATMNPVMSRLGTRTPHPLAVRRTDRFGSEHSASAQKQGHCSEAANVQHGHTSPRC